MTYLSYRLDGEPRLGVIEGDEVRPVRGLTGPGSRTEVGETRERPVPLADVELLPASPNPARILCVGLNYDEHIVETGRDKPTYPVLFTKFASNLIADGEDIELPRESTQVDFEGELAVIIGAPGRRVPESEALTHVLGYAVANDVTMRDFQYKTHQWTQGKAWDRSTPLGATITPTDAVDLSTAGIRTFVNGEIMQDSDLSHLIFTIPRLIAEISVFTTLERGDVILTGTPGGVGYRRDPQVFLRPGDEVVVEIDGVGRLTNRAALERT
jgi:acylpyruvate hydrolase